MGDAPPHAADLHLASACAQGQLDATATFEDLLAGLRPAIAASGASAADIDETLQRLRIQMLVGDPPGIAAYSGRGPLRAWLRVVAMREAVRVLGERGRLQLVGDEQLLERFLPEVDLERDLLGGELHRVFREVFAEAVEALSSRDRLLLRQHAVDDLSIDEIGALHDVNRSTVARWLIAAREELARGTERGLQQRWKASREEVRQVLGLYLSRLDASLARLLSD